MNIIINENQLKNILKKIFQKKEIGNLDVFLKYNQGFFNRITKMCARKGDPLVLYSNYLSTIFPKTKMNKILFHGGADKLKEIDKRYFITYWSTSINYVLSKKLWSYNIAFALVDIRKPFYSDKPLFAGDPSIDDFLNPAYVPDTYDSVIGVDYGQTIGETVAVKNKQVDTHILGTTEDLNKFDDYLRKL